MHSYLLILVVGDCAKLNHVHANTHIYIYIYIYDYVKLSGIKMYVRLIFYISSRWKTSSCILRCSNFHLYSPFVN